MLVCYYKYNVVNLLSCCTLLHAPYYPLYIYLYVLMVSLMCILWCAMGCLNMWCSTDVVMATGVVMADGVVMGCWRTSTVVCADFCHCCHWSLQRAIRSWRFCGDRISESLHMEGEAVVITLHTFFFSSFFCNTICYSKKKNQILANFKFAAQQRVLLRRLLDFYIGQRKVLISVNFKCELLKY